MPERADVAGEVKSMQLSAAAEELLALWVDAGLLTKEDVGEIRERAAMIGVDERVDVALAGAAPVLRRLGCTALADFCEDFRKGKVGRADLKQLAALVKAVLEPAAHDPGIKKLALLAGVVMLCLMVNRFRQADDAAAGLLFVACQLRAESLCPQSPTANS
jgi:hypothetical protein